MTRKPGAQQGWDPPVGPGGKAAERLKMFYEARGISKDPGVDRAYSDYPARVLAAITAAESAAQGQAGLPQWYFIGPDLIPSGQTGVAATRVSVAGRVSAIAVDPQNSNHLLCASGAGGIWESFSRGADWAPRSDFMPTLTTGAIAFDPGNKANGTNIVYAGTGEGNKFWFMGQGMLKSADGGATWAVLPGTAFQADGTTALPGTPFAGTGFYQLIVDPADSKHILAGVNGFAATNGGLYETKDGGATWYRRIATDECFDISMQPSGGKNAEVLAATNGGLQGSTDGGTTWTPVTLPNAPLKADGTLASWTRLAVSISPRDPTVAFVFGASGGKAYLWRRSSTSTSTTGSSGGWSAVTVPNDLKAGQAAYDWYVAAAPAAPAPAAPAPAAPAGSGNTDQVYLGAIDVHRGDLAADGKTWTWYNVSTKTPGDCIHADQHAIVFDGSGGTIYCGCDGGVFRSPDSGKSWFSLNPGLGITEIEYMVNYNSNSQWMLAGTQDNGTLRYRGTTAFEHVDDGDGGDCGADQTAPAQASTTPSTPATCYDTYIKMAMYRSTQGGASGTFNNITPPIPDPLPDGYSLFYPPVGVSGGTIAIAGQSVFISRDTGNNWTEVKLPAPLNAGDPAEIATALYLPSTDLVYAATKTGRIFTITYTTATTNAGWSAPAELLPSPRQAYISAIRVDATSRIWVTMTQVGNATVGGQVWRYGGNPAKWTDLTGNLPAIPVSSIAFGSFTRNNISQTGVWVGADVGVYESLDDGVTWSAFFQNLPYAIVEDLEFHSTARVLRAGTRSRGIWEVAVEKPGNSAPPQGLKACSVMSAGTFDVAATRTDKSVSRNRQTTYPSSSWSGWTSPTGAVGSPPVNVTSPPVIACGRNGCLQIFARGSDGALWQNAETTPGGAWAGWQSLGGILTSRPVLGINYVTNNSLFEMYARGPDGALWQTGETAPGTWSAWQSLGGVITAAPAVAWDYFKGAPSIIVFARMTDASLGFIRQPARTWTGVPATWSGAKWQSLGGAIVGTPAVAVTQPPPGSPTGTSLEVLARGPDNALWYNVQASRGSDSWSGWTSLGGTLAGDPAVTAYQESSIGWLGDPSITGYQNRVAVFARWPDNTVWDIFQSAPGSWTGSAWESRGGNVTSDPVVTLNSSPDRHLEVYARGSDNALWYTTQAADNSSWSAWTSLSGGPFAAYT